MQGQRELWDQAVAFTRDKSPATFDQWFCGVQFDGLTEGVLSLRAMNEFVREWVDEHFVPTLADYIASQSGLSVQVAWTIDMGLGKPVIDRPAGPPVRPRPLVVGDEESHAPNGMNGRSSSTMKIAPAAPPIEGLNPKYTFSNFVVGPSNQLAHA